MLVVVVVASCLGSQVLLLLQGMLLLEWRRVAEALVLGQGGAGAEALAALAAVDLHATVGVHALVPAQIRELSVGLEADLALERLHRRVDVSVLLEAG